MFLKYGNVKGPLNVPRPIAIVGEKLLFHLLYIIRKDC